LDPATRCEASHPHPSTHQFWKPEHKEKSEAEENQNRHDAAELAHQGIVAEQASPVPLSYFQLRHDRVVANKPEYFIR
jgi:hypothetical protein